jgi:hypothetical protein
VTALLLVTALGCALWLGGRDWGRRFSDDPLEQGAIGAGLWLALLPPLLLSAFAAGLSPRMGAILWLALPASGVIGLVRKRWAFGRADAWALGTGAGLFLWLIALQALQPVYDGAGWANDWFEHYQRALFFLHRYPADFPFIGNYILPDRPPNFNLLVASVLPLTGEGYPAYQGAATLLNLLPLLPLALLARRWAPGRAWAVVAAFPLLPLFVRMSAYPWTRGLAAFFILMGLWCTLRGGYGRGRRDALLAFLFLGSACLVHYSSLVVFVPAGLHFLRVSCPTREGRGTFLRAVALVLLLVAPWGAYLVAVHGARTGFTNTTTEWVGRHGFLDVHRIVAENLLNSLVPPVLYQPVFRGMHDPFHHGTVGFYGNSIPGGLTLAFTLALLAAAWAGRRRVPGDREAFRFWALVLPLVFYLGFLVVPEVNRFVGVAHTCLYPLLLLGAARAASWLVTAASAAFRGAALALLAMENLVFHAAFLLDQSALKALEGRPVDNITLINLETKARFHALLLFDLSRPAWPLLAAFAAAGLGAALAFFAWSLLGGRRGTIC